MSNLSSTPGPFIFVEVTGEILADSGVVARVEPGWHPQETEANGRLLAAAPALLAALEAIYELVPFDMPDNDRRLVAALAAIAAAKGDK